MMDVAAYLQRIAYHGSLAPTADTLRALHIAHLHAVPFENLDIQLRRPIALNQERLFEKIVLQRRGGFCYELNGLFAVLLQALRFPVRYLSASDAHPDGSSGPEYDHLTLAVQAPNDDAAQPPAWWLADVGWGDTFCAPLRLDERGVHVEGARAYRLEHEGMYRVLWQRQYNGQWERNYRFTLEPRHYADFAAMCSYHQTSPHSLFTQKRLCTRATPEGRITLDDRRLITTTYGRRQERTITGDDEFWLLLRQHFGMDLGG